MLLEMSPQVAQINVPLTVVRTVTEHDLNAGLSIEQRALVKMANDLLRISILPQMENMKSTQAQAILRLIKPLLKDYANLSKRVHANEQESDVSFRQLVQQIDNLINELIFVAHDRQIDENSDAYQTFFYQLADETSAVGRTFGREKLMVLFD